MRTAILTVSSAISRAAAPDETGPALAALVDGIGGEVVGMEVLPDDFALIEDRLHHYVDAGCALVLTAGGTAATGWQVTAEATRAVVNRELPGIPEALRAARRARDAADLLDRGTAGYAGQTLIVNLPGSAALAGELFAVLAPLLADGRA